MATEDVVASSVDLDSSLCFPFVDAEYGRGFMKSLSALRLRSSFTDVVLKAGPDVSLPCHKVVLSAASTYFLAMFNSGLKESSSDVVEIQGVEPETLRTIVDYIYTTDIRITTANVQSLIQACELFHFTGLKLACEGFMVQQVEPTNCIGFYKFSKLYSLSTLRYHARHCMLGMFKHVVSEHEFKTMSLDELVEYITDDSLNVRTEDPVFEGVWSWIQANPAHGTQDLERLLSQVRFPHCSSAYLCYVIDKTGVLSDVPRCATFVEEARQYHLLPEKRHEMSGVRTVPRDSFGRTNRLVLVGGLTKEEKDNRYCWYLREDTASWELLAQLPKPNWKFYSICVIPNLGILVTGGYLCNVKRDCWLFDSSEKKWKPLTAMLDVRCKHRAVVHNSHVYVIGGEDDFDRPLSSVERLTVKTKRWDSVAAMHKALSDPLVISLGRYIYVFAGIEDNDATSTSSAAFDTVWDSWSPRSEMPEPCRLGAIAAVNDQIYILTGYSRTSLCYNPTLDQWSKLSRPREKHGNAPAVVWNGKILVGGGDVDINQTTSVVEEYDPEEDQWSYWKYSLKEELSCHYLLNVELAGL